LNVLKNHKNHRELHLMAATAAGCPKRCPKMVGIKPQWEQQQLDITQTD